MKRIATQCCAVEEIYELRDHDGDPKGAMLEFCRGHDPYKNGSLYSLYSFYVFTGVVDPGEDKIPFHYVDEFAEFIRENELGTVLVTKGLPNYVNHPNHTVKVAVWAPDRDKLREWWTAHKGEAKKGFSYAY